MEALLNELKVFGELWKKEIQYIQSMKVEERMKLYKKALEMLKRGFRIDDLEWIMNE
ncbi:MAG: hypothetical protein J7K21_01030 [Desulfurococcales archaeon]|nr:hypothetical protein [Desulfurococcales archaeon]